MADNTGIEWTDATWNPVVGCSKVSEGCRNCYAMWQAHRNAAMGKSQLYVGLTEKRSSGVEWNGVVRTVPSKLDQPLRWKRPRKIFVNSMSDLFHPDVPFEFIDQVFAVMALSQQHTFQVLTKRPERMLEYFSAVKCGEIHRFDLVWSAIVDLVRQHGGNGEGLGWPLPNVWIGVSVENQKTADERIPLLLQTPAAVRWLSMEPLLGPVDIWAHIRLMAYPGVDCRTNETRDHVIDKRTPTTYHESLTLLPLSSPYNSNSIRALLRPVHA